MKRDRKITLHSWKPAITSKEVTQAVHEHGELFFNHQTLEDLYFEPGRNFGPIKEGWIEIQYKGGEDCCDVHRQPPTISEIKSTVLDDNETVVVSVIASHPCGIKQISVFLGELAWVRTETGGRRRAPRVRQNPNDPHGGILEGAEETWTRSDSTDGTPVTLNTHFKWSLLRPEALNVWIVRVVNTCDRAVTATTDEFPQPPLGPF